MVPPNNDCWLETMDMADFNTFIAILAPSWVEMSRLLKLVEFDEPPIVPEVKPIALKFAFPADPLLTENGLAELSVTEEM